MSTPHRPPTWTDTDLDDALATLGGTVTVTDDDLARLRARLFDDTVVGNAVVADTVVAGDASTGDADGVTGATTPDLEVRPVTDLTARRRRPLGPLLLLTAAVVVAVAVAVSLVVGVGNRSVPPASPTPTPHSSALEQRLGDSYPLLPADRGTILADQTHTGPATVPFAAPPAAGDAIRYAFSCVDAQEQTAPPSAYTLTDSGDRPLRGACTRIVGDLGDVASALVQDGAAVSGRGAVTVAVTSPDVAWRLIVVATGPGTTPVAGRPTTLSDTPATVNGVVPPLPTLAAAGAGATVRLAPTDGTGNGTVAGSGDVAAGTSLQTAVACVGGGRILVQDAAGGASAVPCDGTAQGTAGVTTTAGPASVTVYDATAGQRWRVAVYTVPASS